VIASALALTPGIDVVASGTSADEAIRATEALLPDVVVMDLNMPGNGIAAAAAINTVFPAVRIVIHSSDDSEHQIGTALRAGAMAYVVKGAPIRELAATLKSVAGGKASLSPAFAEQLLAPRTLAAPWMDVGAALPIGITEREEQILSRCAQGLTNDEIGMGLGLSGETVAKFLTNVLLKLHACERYPALLLAP